ncbi:MAG TPA: NUDIX domain-containing protein [Nocardioidaceae bacterium]|nr:NUDIX domain-containing protein [Nocardioidaceae bacterium]
MSSVGRIVSAGAVVLRKAPGAIEKGALEVLLVHRPKYDDWSFPKGKLDPHEHQTTAAVREVAEETGLDIRLGPTLSTQTYRVRNGGGRARTKNVHYWAARVLGDDDISGYAANDEIDQVAWVALDKARKSLSYPYDVDTLEESLQFRKKSYPLVILRHSKARARSTWHQDDRDRPLTRIGEFQSEQLVPILAAYGVTRLVSSSSRRCWTSVGPYAEVADIEIEETLDVSEEEATAPKVAGVVDALLELKEPSLLCTHRPVLPLVFDRLGVESCALEPGSLAVVHHRNRKVVSVEVHAAPSGR